MTTAPILREGTTLFRRDTGEALITFDSNLQEKYPRDSNTPSYPIEEGLEGTTTQQPLQTTFELVCEVTNTPLVNGLEEPERARSAFDVLNRIVDEGIRLDLATGISSYSDVLLKKWQTARDYTTGQTLVVAMTFVQINVVRGNEVAVPPSILAAAVRSTGSSETKKDPPVQDPTPDQAEKVNQSVLYSVFGKNR